MWETVNVDIYYKCFDWWNVGGNINAVSSHQNIACPLPGAFLATVSSFLSCWHLVYDGVLQLNSVVRGFSCLAAKFAFLLDDSVTVISPGNNFKGNYRLQEKNLVLQILSCLWDVMTAFPQTASHIRLMMSAVLMIPSLRQMCKPGDWEHLVLCGHQRTCF